VPTDVIMPALGMAQETGKVLRWLKRQGDSVREGEPLLEIETDKATVELEAPASGVLADVSAAEGDEVPVGRVIARIVGLGELSAEESAPVEASAAAAAPAPAAEAPPAAAQMPTAPAPVPAAPAASTAPGTALSPTPALVPPSAPTPPSAVKAGRVAASPKARRLAAEYGVDLRALAGAGSGPGGAVLAADVLAAVRAGAAAPAPVPGPAPVEAPGTAPGRAGGPPPAGAPAATPALPNVWRRMAERTTQSWTSVPHFFLLREAHAGRLVTWREKAAARLGVDLTYTDLLVKLVATALREHPRLNARWQDGAIVTSEAINVGIAVATDDGLVVPVIGGADRLSLDQVARRRAELVERARAGRLRPEDLAGGTFTISNLGMYGIDAFTAIINPPQAAILAVGRIAPRVVPAGARAAVRPMLWLALSCDHRVVDGARGAAFLQTLAELIEEPLGLLQ
jgi:pyruvate dehydrogenase E2 component (dihydrolipoamide acetyltransferase)